jgi:putative inorganic carbon (HCO3(-)) transporter
VPIRDIIVTAAVFGLLPACFFQPWVGILVWSWIGYMNPHRLTWGFARAIPFAQLVAVTTLTGLVLGLDRERKPIPWVRETWLLAGLWAIYTVTTLAALYPDEAWPQWIKVSKILLLTFVTLILFQSRTRLRSLLMVIALSIGFYGLKAGPWAVATGGVHHVQGPEGTFIGGNTEIGLALNMVLPLLVCLAREEPRRWLRNLMWTTFGCSIVAILFTYSRGALLGLPIVLGMLFLSARRRVGGLVVVGLIGVLVYSFAPPEWYGRAQMITEYEEDESARSRLVSWRVAWGLALDRPLTGGGFWALPQWEIFGRYAPEHPSTHSAHSIYFGVLGDHGFPGLLLFVGLIVSCLASLRRIRRRFKGDADAQWLVGYARAVEVSLVAYAVSGAFLTLAYWDLFYHLVVVVVILRVLADRGAEATETGPKPVAMRRAPVSLVRIR